MSKQLMKSQDYLNESATSDSQTWESPVFINITTWSSLAPSVGHNGGGRDSEKDREQLACSKRIRCPYPMTFREYAECSCETPNQLRA